MSFTVVEAATTMREALTENYRSLAKLADQAEQELTRMAAIYRDTDTQATARIDATYPV